MKKLFSLLFLACLLSSLVSCTGVLTDPYLMQTETKEEMETSEKETGEIIYPKEFSVGFASVDISGDPEEFPLAYYGGIATGVHDPLMLTCVALWDGENAALVMTADLKKMYDTAANQCFSIIERKFNIASANIILSCTHTHAAPDVGEFKEGSSQWLQQFYKKLPQVVEEALRDLTPVEGAYTGKDNTKDLVFVRRYLMDDGSYVMNPKPEEKPIAHESEADPEMRTIRFEREGKKDVLLVNFQTHYGGADVFFPNQLSADFVDLFRTRAEKELDCHFAYYSGAGGNVVLSSRLNGEQKYSSYLTAMGAFMDAAKGAIAKEEKAELGKICAVRNLYMGTAKQFSDELLEKAREVVRAGGENTEQGRTLIKKYNFDGMDEIDYIQLYQNQDPQLEVNLNAISFGEIAFVGAPYEMFDQNGKDIREASPFKTTFICTLSGDALGYVPTAIAFEHGSYETYNCRFVAGSGEEFANELIRLLRECYK